MSITTLKQITSELGFMDLFSELQIIESRNEQSNCPLIIPLVGEFSSGKTTLINSLTESKKLETATKPTTATIYEVHFGAEISHATILDADGGLNEVKDLSELKNELLKDAKVVTVFDTSTKISPSTVLVDTPGLSSPDPKHRQTLIDFLPQADAILLVSDINQQITKSLIDFVQTISLSKRPIYLVLTKCDTKSTSELLSVKKYISENININLENITCVSAKTEKLEELYSLFEQIKQNKSKILKEVNAQRIKNIVLNLQKKVDELIKSTEKDTDSDEEIRKKKSELNLINRKIDQLIESMSMDIQNQVKSGCSKFEDIVFNKLDTLVIGKSNNFDADAISIINNTSSLILNEFKSEIKSILQQKATQARGTENDIDLHSLNDIDMNNYSIDGLSYNLDLNSVGHEYDGYIATGVKVAGAVAAVATVTVAGGAIIKGGTAILEKGVAIEGAKKAINIDSIANIADTASDIGSIYSNKKMASRIQKAVGYAENASKQYSKLEEKNQNIGKQVGSNRGIVESLVGFVTDHTMGKPQRRRAIHDYMDNTLLPGFKSEISRISDSLIGVIKSSLKEEASDEISEMSNALEELQNLKKEKKADYDQRISMLEDYKKQLSLM